MVQKASFFPTKTDVLIKNKKMIDELYGLNRLRISTKQVALPLAGGGTPSQATESGGTGNFLRTQGDTMIGPIAFFPVVVAIDGADAIDIGQGSGTDNSPDYSSFAFVSGGPTNDLELIKGAAFSGQWLILQFAQTEIITIEDFSNNVGGNILTPDGNNIVVDNTKASQVISLIFDVTASPNGNTGGWRVLTISASSLTQPFITPVDHRTSPGTSVTFDLSTRQHFVLELSQDVLITLANPPPVDDTAEQYIIELIQDGTGGHTTTFTNTLVPVLPALDETANTTVILVGFVRRHASANTFYMFIVGNP